MWLSTAGVCFGAQKHFVEPSRFPVLLFEILSLRLETGVTGWVGDKKMIERKQTLKKILIDTRPYSRSLPCSSLITNWTAPHLPRDLSELPLSFAKQP